MEHLKSSFVCAFALWFGLLGCTAAETPHIGAAPSQAGPLVDVTLKSGESNKGQLLAFTGGSLSLKLDNGAVVTQDGASVVSVRFIAPEKAEVIPGKRNAPTAQETEMAASDIDRLNALRWRDNPSKGVLAQKLALPPLTEKEKAELTRLRARADAHISALEQELPNAASEEAAHAKLLELGRYYFCYGLPAQEIRPLLHKAALGIKNDAVRSKVEAGLPALWQSFVEKHKNYKAFEKIYEKLIEKNALEKDRAPADARAPGASEKTPVRPPANN